MPSTDDLLQAIVAAPDDDAPRLACADALDREGDPRGSFIRLQLRVATARRNDDLPARWRGWESEADQLRARHGSGWAAALCPPCSRPVFVRGFVEHVTIPARDLIEHGARLLAQAPIRHLDLTGTRSDAPALFDCPWLAGIRSLSLDRFGLLDADLAALADSRFLPALEWLELMRNEIGHDGARALAASSKLPRLRYVGFFGNRIDPTEDISTDQGVVVGMTMPADGRRLEAEFGRVPWLHVDARSGRDYPPARY